MPDTSGPAMVNLLLHAFEMSAETDARCCIKLLKHHQAAFRFLLDECGQFQPTPKGNILLQL